MPPASSTTVEGHLTTAPVTGGARPVRRTQEERRTSTRRALVDATVSCLVERGYAGTTTAEVQARASVSRGALTHHFSSKADLLLAAVDHLYEAMTARVVAEAAPLPEGPERLRPALALLWSTYDGPLFAASMELWTAARTDADLRAALLPHERRLGSEIRRLGVLVLGDAVHGPARDALLEVLNAAMRGQALGYWLQPEAPRDGPHLDHWERAVRAVARGPGYGQPPCR